IALGFEFETRRSKTVEAAPKQAIDEHDDRGHDERRGQQYIEAAGVAGAADGVAESGSRNNPALEVKIFRDDAGVPRATRGRHQPGDEIGKDTGQDKAAPAIPRAEMKNVSDFFQVRGNGHGAGDDVEEDVPLRAEKHQEHGGQFETAAETKKEEKKDREERGSWNRSRNLYEGLSDAREARMGADGDTGGNGPQSAENERSIDAQKGERGALHELDVVFVMEPR